MGVGKVTGAFALGFLGIVISLLLTIGSSRGYGWGMFLVLATGWILAFKIAADLTHFWEGNKSSLGPETIPAAPPAWDEDNEPASNGDFMGDAKW